MVSDAPARSGQADRLYGLNPCSNGIWSLTDEAIAIGDSVNKS